MKPLALAGILIAALSLTGCGAEKTMYMPAPETTTAPTTSQRAPADKINLCTGTVAEPVPSATGLELTVDFPDAEVGARSVVGTVTLTNTSASTVTGTTGQWPAITLSQNGTVLWHTNGATDLVGIKVNLAPGAMLEYQGSFSPVACGVDDDLAQQFSDRLPPLPSGEYDVSAAIDLIYPDGIDLITGPSETVTLR